MRKLFSKLWADDRGFIISVEMLFIATILVIGLIAGWAGLRAAIVTEYTELGNAILALNEGYVIQSVSGSTGGSNQTTVTDNIAAGTNQLSIAAGTAGAAATTTIAINDLTIAGYAAGTTPAGIVP